MLFCSFFAVHMFSEAHFLCRNFTWSQEETDLEAHSCNPSILETEARGHLVQGQPGLPSWAWLQKHKYKTTYVSRAQLDKHNPIYTHLCIATINIPNLSTEAKSWHRFNVPLSSLPAPALSLQDRHPLICCHCRLIPIL